MSNTKDLKPSNLKVLVYGPFRTKKTLFAGSFPSPYFFDYDDGMMTLAGQDVEYDTFMDEDPNKPSAFSRSEAHLKAMQANIKRGESESKFETIIVDSMTTLMKTAMNLVLLLNGRPGGAPQQNDWLPQMTMIEGFIYRLRSIPRNIVVICHEDAVKDEVIGNLRILPSITGKLATRIPNLFDFVFHSETVFLKEGKSKIQLRVHSTPTLPTGPRLKINQEFIEPTYEALMKAIEEGRSPTSKT